MKKRMLLAGPGYGHNVVGKLRSLNSSPLFDVTFLSINTDEANIKEYTNIHFLPWQLTIDKWHPIRTMKSLIWLWKQVRSSGHFDVIYLLGLANIPAALLFLFCHKDVVKVLHIWTDVFIASAEQKKGLLGKLDYYVIAQANIVCQSWWGMRERFVKAFPQYENKFMLFPLQYTDQYFNRENLIPQSDFVKSFLASIPKDQVVCFWPKSFLPSTNHIAMLKAIALVRDNNADLLSNFKLYLWGGNVQNEDCRLGIENTIVSLSINNYVVIVDHPFVSKNDMFVIEERSDFFVQISNDDVLSSYIMEMITSGKPFLLSNLRTYQFLNEVYDLNIELVENDPTIISDKLIDILSGKPQFSKDEYNRRMRICEENFSKSRTKTWIETLYERLS